ncbi:uncharacterized protein LOC143230312 isoform X2 [Tachypleus tridentatus]|uniref:uncharacterized protein LOC143230312 isoform X2 n=1 Tax=Tachypleus tridentatus TaxID=6853 RepID=UPI003FD66BDA
MFLTISILILTVYARPLYAVVTCGDPGDPRNGRKLDFVFEFPRSIRFECNKGYQLVGKKELFCLPNGQWSSSVPRCEIKKCPQPSSPKDGSVSFSGITYDSVIRYYCEKGFSLSGLKERRCLEDGTWSGEEPFCVEQACERPEKPVGGRMVLPSEKITIGTLAIFACDEGTTMVGSKVLKCVEEGIWTFDPPKCLRHCQFPPLANGKFVSKHQYGRCYYGWNSCPVEDEKDVPKPHGENSFVKCNSDYEFRGLRRISSGHEIICNDGQWDPVPRCVPAKCRLRPPFIENGYPLVTEGDHGTVVSYNCSSFYVLQSKGSITCSYGKWIGKSAVCKDTRCYRHNLEQHNYYGHQHSVQSGDKLSFECNNGYERIINAEIKCRLGEWIGNLKPCKPARCYTNQLNEDHYTVVYKEYYENNETLQFHCVEGYEKYTYAEIKCDLGKWTEIFQPCKPKKCYQNPPSIENGYTVVTEGDHGTLVSYQCNHFYALNSSGTIKCSYGHWIGTPATCKDIRCYTEALKQENIIILHEGSYLNGENLTFECDEGYERHADIKCNFGVWTGLLESCRPESKPEDDENTSTIQPDENKWDEQHCELVTSDKDLKVFYQGKPVMNGDRVKDGGDIMLFCLHGKTVNNQPIFKKVTCHNGQWNMEIPSCPFDSESSSEERVVSEEHENTNLSTSEDSRGNLTEPIFVDMSRISQPEKTVVTGKQCTVEKFDDSVKIYYKGSLVNQGDRIPDEDRIVLQCTDSEKRKMLGTNEIYCKNGKWNYKYLPRCVLNYGTNELSVIVLPSLRSAVRRDGSGVLLVKPHIKLSLLCKNKNVGTAYWQTTVQADVNKGIRYSNIEKELSYILFDTTKFHTGNYTCSAPSGGSVMLQVVVTDFDKNVSEDSKGHESTDTSSEDSLEGVTESFTSTTSYDMETRKHCKLQRYDTNLSIYHKGNLVKAKDHIPDGEWIKFRCIDTKRRHLFGVNTTYCEDGKWNHSWFPECLLKYGTEDLLVLLKPSSHSEVVEDSNHILYVKPLEQLKLICRNKNSVPVNWKTTVKADVTEKTSFSISEKEIYLIEFNATKFHTGNYTCSYPHGSSVTLQVIVTDDEEPVTEQQLSTSCKIGIYDNNLRIFYGVYQVKTGDVVPDGGRILFHCEPIGKTQLHGKNKSFCNKGSWADKVFPTCVSNDAVIELNSQEEEIISPGGIVVFPPLKYLYITCRSNNVRFRPVLSTEVKGVNPYDCRREVCSRILLYTRYHHSGTYTCQASKNSISIYLVIQSIRCPVIPHSPGLVMKYKHSFVQFSCEDQYQLLGSTNITCMNTHQWSQNVPVCQARDLEEPVTEHHLQTFCKIGIYDDNLKIFYGKQPIKTGDEVPDGGRILFHCDPVGKSQLYGKNEAYCDKGSWVDKVFPTCDDEEPVTEQQLPTSCKFGIYDDNLRIFYGVYKVKTGDVVPDGGRILFHCEPIGKTQLYGKNESFCNKGSWADKLFPTCVSNDAVIELNSREEEIISPGGIVVFPPQKYLYITCRSNNRYFRPVLSTEVKGVNTYGCRRELCSRIYLYTNYQHSGTYTCRTSSESSVSFDLVIQSIRCPVIPHSSGLVIQYEHSFVQFSCESQYQLLGSTNATCMNTRQWSQNVPVCQTRGSQCSAQKLYEAIPAEITPKLEKEIYEIGEEVEVFCHNPGSFIVGNKIVLCSPKGHWNVQKLTCEKGCEPLQPASGSPIIITNPKPFYHFGESMILSCPEGHQLENGIFRVMCLAPIWSQNSLPNCISTKITHS